MGAVEKNVTGIFLKLGLEDSGTKVLVADLERVERTRESAARLGIATVGVRERNARAPES